MQRGKIKEEFVLQNEYICKKISEKYKVIDSTVPTFITITVVYWVDVFVSPVQLLAENTYNELGQLLSKKVGNSSAFPLQKVDYTYNIRGWLTGINNVGGDPALAPNPLQKNSDPFDLFAFKINFNTVKNEVDYTGTALYNGNISETYWRTSSDNQLRKYGYSYDNLNRLRTAVYQRPGATLPVTNMYDESMSYDKNGNIMTLQRKGDYDAQTVPIPIDDLTYGYDTTSNQLLWVKENSNNNGTLGFKDLATYAGNNTNAVPDYGYDANGNMTKDLNKGINPLGSNPIKYNHLNLPTEIYFSATKKINYIYSATGVKLQKIVQSTKVTTTDYLDGFQYLKPTATGAVVLQFFPTTEGYVNLDSGVYKYVFNYLDHLGNVRLSYTKNEATGLAVIMEENHYYPSGLKHTNYNTTVMKLRGSAVQVSSTNPYKYKYNGCEYQEELGLNLYDMDLRDYDPAIGRWTGIDPIVHFDQSPYMAMNGNPVVFADPSGADGVVYGMAGQSAWSNPYPRGHDSYGNTSYRSGTESPQAEFGSWGESAPSGIFWGTASSQYKQSYEGHNGTQTYYGTNAVRVLRGYGSKWVPGKGPETPGNVTVYSGHWAQGGGGGMGTAILDGVQTGLDVVGLVPGFGEIADGVNALIYTGRGDYVNAGLSAAAMIPLVGWAATGGKLAGKTLQITSKARTAERGLEIGGRFLSKGYSEIAPGVFRSSDGLRQFRMTDADILGKHGNIGPHFNFEILDAQGNFLRNHHMPIK